MQQKQQWETPVLTVLPVSQITHKRKITNLEKLAMGNEGSKNDPLTAELLAIDTGTNPLNPTLANNEPVAAS